MARTLKDERLDTRAARSGLRAQGKPHWRLIEEGLHLGYRKPKGSKGPRARAGKWVVRHYIGGQNYHVETVAAADDFTDADGIAILNFKQAQALARERMKRRAHDGAGKSGGPLTVRRAIEAYLEFLESNRKSGGDAGYRAAAFILPKLGDIEVEDLTTDRLNRWLADLAKMAPRLRTKEGDAQKFRDVKAGEDKEEALRKRQSTANRTLTVLKAALNRAWRLGKTSSDAAWRRVEPFENVDSARIRYLSIAEAKRLVNATDSQFRPMVRAALFTGARYGELAHLAVADFNPESETLAIRQSKSGKPRHVVVTNEGAKYFHQLCAGGVGSDVLLPRANGQAWDKSHQARPMKEACKRAKIDPPIGFHGLRHTYASLAVMNGTPLLVLAKNLGHADTRMVEKHYGHLAPSYVADAIRAGAPKFGFKTDRKIAAIGR
jgi:integrase